MSTSGTAIWNPDYGEIVEEAYERCGLEVRSGYDLRTARRSANLLNVEWANRGLNLFTISPTGEILPLVAGQSTYTLPADTIDVLDGAVRTNSGLSSQTDIIINRITFSGYLSYPNKTSLGRPILYTISRQSAAPTITFFEVPDATPRQFVYYRLRRIQDAGNVGQTADIPARFVDAYIAGLAARIAQKRPKEVDSQTIIMLQQSYEAAYDLAAQEDRERAPLRFGPYLSC